MEKAVWKFYVNRVFWQKWNSCLVSGLRRGWAVGGWFCWWVKVQVVCSLLLVVSPAWEEVMLLLHRRPLKHLWVCWRWSAGERSSSGGCCWGLCCSRLPSEHRDRGEDVVKAERKEENRAEPQGFIWYIFETENQEHLIDTIQYLNRIHQNDFWICSLIWHLWAFWVVCIF